MGVIRELSVRQFGKVSQVCEASYIIIMCKNVKFVMEYFLKVKNNNTGFLRVFEIFGKVEISILH